MDRIRRREFVRWLVQGATGALLAACAPGQATPTGEAGPTPTLRIVRNMNRPDRNVRYYRPFAPPTREDWRLEVTGLVTNALTLTFDDIQQFPLVEQNSRMVCVEGWSYRSDWGGFTMQSLLEQVQPQANGQYVRMTCFDEYYEVLPLEDLLRERVLLVYRQDGQLLATEYGAPLRTIIPWKWGYKGPKCITKIDFVAEDARGYWSTVGPYTAAGDIEEGNDYAQDRKDFLPRVPGKEQTY